MRRSPLGQLLQQADRKAAIRDLDAAAACAPAASGTTSTIAGGTEDGTGIWIPVGLLDLTTFGATFRLT